ncbi:MAG: transposase [Desulfitobacteriaceae bacterium]
MINYLTTQEIDFKRFKDHNSLAKYVGLVWNQHQSG